MKQYVQLYVVSLFVVIFPFVHALRPPPHFDELIELCKYLITTIPEDASTFESGVVDVESTMLSSDEEKGEDHISYIKDDLEELERNKENIGLDRRHDIFMSCLSTANAHDIELDIKCKNYLPLNDQEAYPAAGITFVEGLFDSGN